MICESSMICGMEMKVDDQNKEVSGILVFKVC